MKITFIKGNEVKTIDDWKLYAAPKGKGKQWVEGRSAWCMADFAINHPKQFQSMITDILKECAIELQNFSCEPEAVAGLGKGMKSGGQRNHDLLMIGSMNCVIGIEAKVSESFDEPFGKVYEKGGNKKARAYALKKFLTPEKDVDKIGYQLFTATRGSMVSAMKAGYTNAILLIIVFEGKIKLNKGETEEDYEQTIKKNDEDFVKFLKNVGADGHGMIQRVIEGKTINCWIKKIKINIPTYTSVE